MSTIPEPDIAAQSTDPERSQNPARRVPASIPTSGPKRKRFKKRRSPGHGVHLGIPDHHIEELREHGYIILGRIGSGGEGLVFKAAGTRHGVAETGIGFQKLAIKCKHPDEDESTKRLSQYLFKRENAINVTLREGSNPLRGNIIPIVDIVTLTDGTQYMISKLITRGGEKSDDLIPANTLNDEIHALHTNENPYRCRARLRRCLEWFHELCLTVHYCHSKGVIHRDLKPENILIQEARGGTPEEREDRPYLSDFGLAQVRDVDAYQSRIALNTELVTDAEERDVQLDKDEAEWLELIKDMGGTFGYMAPEQTGENMDTIDNRTDVYGLGAILYHILRGEPPYSHVKRGPDENKIICNEDPKPPKSLNPRIRIGQSLQQIALKAMNRNKDDRYESAEALALDIERYIKDLPVSVSGLLQHPILLLKRKLSGIITAFSVAAPIFGILLYSSSRKTADRIIKIDSTVNHEMGKAITQFKEGNRDESIGKLSGLAVHDDITSFRKKQIQRAIEIMRAYKTLEENLENLIEKIQCGTGVSKEERVENPRIRKEIRDCIREMGNIRSRAKDSSFDLISKKNWNELREKRAFLARELAFRCTLEKQGAPLKQDLELLSVFVKTEPGQLQPIFIKLLKDRAEESDLSPDLTDNFRIKGIVEQYIPEKTCDWIQHGLIQLHLFADHERAENCFRAACRKDPKNKEAKIHLLEIR